MICDGPLLGKSVETTELEYCGEVDDVKLEDVKLEDNVDGKIDDIDELGDIVEDRTDEATVLD